MNNDAIRLNLGAKGANNSASNAVKANIPSAIQENNDEKSMKDTFEYLKAMGYAQVNMDNLISQKSVRIAMEKFLQNPELIQEHVEFCDALVACGYSLEEAIEKSDIVFSALKNQNMYS